MTTQELKNKIEKVLGNSIRCLLPSYWWKNLFHSVADRIDEVETTVTENVSDMVVRSLKEFEAKHPDMASRTLVYTEDANSAEARKNSVILHKWVLEMGGSTAGTKINPLYIAVPIMPITFRIEGYSILSPTYRFNSSKYGVEFLDVPMDDGQIYNISFSIIGNGEATHELASSSSGGVEIRDLRISGSDEDNAYNLQTVELYKESKAIVVIPVAYHSSNPERTDRMQMPYYVDLYTNTEGVVAKFTFMVDDFRGGKYLINYTIKDDGSIEGSSSYTFDSAMSDESVNAVQNKVIKKYIDDSIANVGGGGGGNIVVDTEISSTSTNPVQNKVVFSELQKKQGTINDLADIRSGAALGKTALQSEQYKGTITGVSANGTSVATSGVANIPAASTSAYGVTKLSSATNSTSTSLAATASAVKAAYDLANNYKGTVTGVKINGTTKNPSSGIVDLGTVITAHQDISHLATKEELNSLTNEIISNERVHAASLVDIDARIQDIVTRLNNAGL